MTNQADFYLNEFLYKSIEHLAKKPDGFFERLEKGEVSAVKMLLDYISKITPKDDSKHQLKNKETVNIEELPYEKAFEELRDKVSEQQPDSED